MNNQNPSTPEQNVAQVKAPRCFMNLGTIPTSYKDSMDYYQTVAWLCKYLQNDVIPVINTAIENINDLQDFSVDIEEELETITNSIPTKVSQLQNDSQYITNAVHDLTYYYDKTYIDNTIGDISTVIDTINGEVI